LIDWKGKRKKRGLLVCECEVWWERGFRILNCDLSRALESSLFNELDELEPVQLISLLSHPIDPG
jgi:hypothetical protein